MGTSEAKRQANRRNAQCSTGPTSEEGKARSAMNAVKHGILANSVVIDAGDGVESLGDFETLLAGLTEEFEPATEMEKLLVQELAIHHWRLNRVYRFEAGAIRAEADEAVSEWLALGRIQQRHAESRIQRAFEEERRNTPMSPLLPDVDLEDRLAERGTWDATEEIEEDIASFEGYLTALNAWDVGKDAVIEVCYALAEAGWEQGVDVPRILGKRSEEWQGQDVDRAGIHVAPKLLAAYGRELGKKPEAALQHLRGHFEGLLQERRKLLKSRRLAEQRVQMLASIPTGDNMQRVLRYEAHLSRRITQTLHQLRILKAQSPATGGGPEVGP